MAPVRLNPDELHSGLVRDLENGEAVWQNGQKMDAAHAEAKAREIEQAYISSSGTGLAAMKADLASAGVSGSPGTYNSEDPHYIAVMNHISRQMGREDLGQRAPGANQQAEATALAANLHRQLVTNAKGATGQMDMTDADAEAWAKKMEAGYVSLDGKTKGLPAMAHDLAAARKDPGALGYFVPGDPNFEHVNSYLHQPDKIGTGARKVMGTADLTQLILRSTGDEHKKNSSQYASPYGDTRMPWQYTSVATLDSADTRPTLTAPTPAYGHPAPGIDNLPVSFPPLPPNTGPMPVFHSPAATVVPGTTTHTHFTAKELAAEIAKKYAAMGMAPPPAAGTPDEPPNSGLAALTPKAKPGQQR